MYITQTQMVPQYIELRQCSTLGYCVCFLVRYVHNMIPAGSDQAWLVQTDSTVSLPGFPTLLSAEGDFFIIAGSIHITHNTFNNTSQSRRGEDRRERKRRSVTSQRKQDLKETSSGKTEKVQKPADPRRRTEETPLKNMCTCVHVYFMLPLVGPLRDPMACCSSDTFSRRTTSARADFRSWISSSCIWTLCSREAMRSVTSILLAADALSSEGTVNSCQRCRQC